MPITHSLDNLLLDDDALDDQPILGPVVPMRWMSNLFRLALLEETDRQLVADGLDPRHEAEIRRLRRMSMAPAVGRFYPVGGDSPDPGQHILPDQARHLVELWRTRQPLPDDDPESEYLDNGSKVDDPEIDFDDEYLDDNELDESDFQDDDPEDDDFDENNFEVSNFEEPDEWPDEDYPEDEQRSDQPKASPLLIPSSHHRLISGPWDDRLEENDFEESDGWSESGNELRPSRGTSFAGAAAIAVAVLAALLFLVATWYVKSRTQPTAPHSAPAGILSPTIIVPSAIPRNPVSAGAVRILVSPNTKHQTLMRVPKPTFQSDPR